MMSHFKKAGHFKCLGNMALGFLTIRPRALKTGALSSTSPFRSNSREAIEPYRLAGSNWVAFSMIF